MSEALAEEMYREHILELYKHPENFGVLKNATKTYTLNNPLCGDEITMQVIIQDDKIKDVKFLGKGCAISIASASLLTDKVKEMNIKDVMKLTKGDVVEMLEIPLSPVRLKCALLCLETLQKTIMGV